VPIIIGKADLAGCNKVRILLVKELKEEL